MQQVSLCSTHQREQRSTPPKGCSVCQRINVERDIVLRVVDVLLSAGFWLQSDALATEAMEEGPTNDRQVLVDALMETDDEYLQAYGNSNDGTLTPAGWVRFVYGNDGWDVINDYTVNLEAALRPVLDYIDKEYA